MEQVQRTDRLSAVIIVAVLAVIVIAGLTSTWAPVLVCGAKGCGWVVLL